MNTVHTVCKQQLDAVARVAQWLEHRAQRYLMIFAWGVQIPLWDMGAGVV
jgi:hypothetical protein